MTIAELRTALEFIGAVLVPTLDRDLELELPAEAAVPDDVMGALAEHKAALLADRNWGKPDPAPPAPPVPWPPRDPELATWPIDWRERWGRLANNLEASGMPWPDAERKAFLAIRAELEANERSHGPVARTQPTAGMSDADAVVAIDWAFSGPHRPTLTVRGPRDHRRGDEWLPRHTQGKEAMP